MRRRLTIIVVGVVGLLATVVVVAWAVLNGPFFVDFRRSVVENVLSKQIGQTLIIDQDVRVDLGPISRIHVSGVRIPSENITNVALAELETFELDVDLLALLKGAINIDNLAVHGLTVNLLRNLEGAKSWSDQDQLTTPKSEDTAPENGGVLDFLHDKTASITEINLLIENEKSGFVFDFDLNSLQLDQLEDGQRVAVTGDGAVNGEPFAIKGDYPRGKDFTTRASFGQLTMALDGSPLPAGQGNGYTAELSLDTGEFGEVLDILRLERVLEGRGQLSARISGQSGTLAMSDFETNIDLADGQSIRATGDVMNLLEATGLDLSVEARLYPEDNLPARAHELADLKLTGISAHIVSEDQALKFESLEFATNAFDQEFSQLGPVSIGRIMRSETGQLSMQDIAVQIGPAEAPYVVAKGDMQDLLQLKGIDFDGVLAASATMILPPSEYANAAEFGRVHADFSVTDSTGQLTLSKLHASTRDTTLWSLESKMSVASVADLEGLDFNMALALPDGKSFLTALDLKPIDTGAVGLSVSATRQGDETAIKSSFAVSQSRLDVTLDSTRNQIIPIVRGRIASDLLEIDDLKNAVASAIQIASLSSADAKRPEEPLVVEKEEEPLVTEKPEEPLVMNGGVVGAAGVEEPTDFFDLVGFLGKLDLQIGIEIASIRGQQGVSAVASTLTVKDAKAQFGPLEFNYGGGYFNVSAAMDIAQSPDHVTVSGATQGWDLGEILKNVGVNLDARGKLRADFNLTGTRTSAKAFVNSMNGSATVSMSGGAIASSLLELAGLGVFPWLFSAELNRGYTNIVCAVAPLKIQSGKVSSNSTVIETERVQMVIAGNLDWKNETISMRAEPRPVGRPLARSAWPINITGSLRKPDLQLLGTGSRPAPKGGARQMPANRTPCKPDARQLQ